MLLSKLNGYKRVFTKSTKGLIVHRREMTKKANVFEPLTAMNSYFATLG